MKQPDLLTKLLLGAIALGLWANALAPWFEPVPVQARPGVARTEAQASEIRSILRYVRQIASGTCRNSTIC